MRDVVAARDELRRSATLQSAIWAEAAVCGRSDASPDACRRLLPALNEMIDITTTRTAAAQIHSPPVVPWMLVALAFVSALLGGYGLAAGRSRKVLHMVAYAAVVLAFTIVVIVDFEYPRLGFIRGDPIDSVLGELRSGMR